MGEYRGKGFTDPTLTPHIFALADEAYNNMRSPRLQTGNTGNQVIVIRFLFLGFFPPLFCTDFFNFSPL